jgi:hypothetical protein
VFSSNSIGHGDPLTLVASADVGGEPPWVLGHRHRPARVRKSTAHGNLPLIFGRTHQLDPLITDETGTRSTEQIELALNAVARQDVWVLEGMGQDIPEHVWRRATTVICLG